MVSQSKLLENVRNSGLGVKTYTTYLENIERMKKWSYKSRAKSITIQYLLTHPEEVFENISNLKSMDGTPYNEDTKANYFYSLYAIIKNNQELRQEPSFIRKKVLSGTEVIDENIYDIWVNKLDYYKNIKKTVKRNETSEKSDDLKDNWISYETIVEKVLELRSDKEYQKKISKNWKEYQKYLLLEFVTQIAPKRCELREVHLLRERDDLIYRNEDGMECEYNLEDVNYIKLSDSNELDLVLNKFKTVKGKMIRVKDPIVEKLSETLTEQIKRSYELYPRKFLFALVSDPYETAIYAQSSYTTIFQAAFQTHFWDMKCDLFKSKNKTKKDFKITPTKYRKIFATYYMDTNWNVKDLRDLARLMGTSMKMLVEVYRKMDDKWSDDGEDSEK